MPRRACEHAVVPRRSLVLGLVAAGLLTGCRVHLEEGAPDIPMLPRREPVPLEDVLLALLASTSSLARAAGDADGALGAPLARIHTTQANLLQDVLLHGGVPAGEVAGAAAAAPSPGTPPLDARGLAAAELSGVHPPGRLAAAATDLRPALCALCAQRSAASELLAGVRLDTRGAALAPRAANALVDVRRALARSRYFFQIVAARSAGSQRTRAVEAIGALQQRIQDVETQLATAPELPLGYPLPLAVTSGQTAAALARHAAADLLAAYGRALPTMTAGAEPAARATFEVVTPWLADAVVLGYRWGVPLTAFPGLS